MTKLLAALLLLSSHAAAQAPRRPALNPHTRLTGRPAPHALARNLINGSRNVRALHAHLEALDKEDPRQFKEWVGALKVLAVESTTLRWSLQQGRALLKNGVELDPQAVDMSFEPGPPLDLPPQLDADGARVALALAAVEEAEPMAAAIILRAQGADELDRISAFEAAAEEASRRVKEQRDQLARLAGEKAVDLDLSAAPKTSAAPAPGSPSIMGGASKPAPRRDP